MKALFFTRDLFFSSGVISAARDQGIAMTMVTDQRSLLQQLETEQVHLILLDLADPTCDPAVLVPLVRHQAGYEGPIVAFGPHVDAQSLRIAHDVGCDAVLTRGQFHRQMRDVLQQWVLGARDHGGNTQP